MVALTPSPFRPSAEKGEEENEGARPVPSCSPGHSRKSRARGDRAGSGGQPPEERERSR
jgi:hypothetical protein